MGRKQLSRWTLAAGLLAFGLAQAACAEVGNVRIAQQFGISYLPLTVMQQKHLFEKRAEEVGIDLKVDWLKFSAGSGMNEALLSGSIDLASGGVGPMLTIWGKTVNNLKVKGVAALNAMPLFLVTTDPAVKSIKDFTAKDKIALPGVKTSIQAITLQMAAEKAFGPDQRYKLDPLTVSMGHPDAETALLGGHSEIDAHFGSSPYQEQELADPRVHKVLDSYAVLGGPHTFNVVWATTKFVNSNPKVIDAFVAALEDSEAQIKEDPAAAAAVWIKAEGVKMPVAQAEKIIRDSQNEWTTTPKKVLTFLDYMNRAGLVSAKTGDWRDIFFPNIHAASGS
jgi:NitT/TauT family transport system substrate-binding protein